MSTPADASASPRRRVLFVDDDAQFLATVKELMAALSGGAWAIETAEAARDAFALLQDHAVDLAVVDIQMSVMDGIQMLSLLNRGYPNVQKVVLTGYPTEANRAACLANGAELFLEKPTSQVDWQNLHVTLNELLRVPPEAGFRGVLRRVGLQDVLQMECLARNSSVLEIADRQQHGEIFVEEGTIVHAQVGELQGEAAFNFLLGLGGGQFNLKSFREPPVRTIEGPWEFLLMEAARKKDEAAAVASDVALAGPPTEAAVVDPDLPEAEVLEPPPSPEIPPGAPSPDLPAPPPSNQMLVCSAQGEILYEWQVRDSGSWISFLEFLSQRTQRLGQGLRLGNFDHVEIEAPPARFVVLLSPESGVMIRSESDGQAVSPGAPVEDRSTKEALAAWQRQSPPLPGELLRAIRFPDKIFVCGCTSPSFPVAVAEPAWRCVTDTFHVLGASRIAGQRLVWHYERATLHCARRADDTLFGVLIDAREAPTSASAATALLDEFRRFTPGEAVPP